MTEIELIEKAAKKEIERVSSVINEIELADPKGNSLLQMAKYYFADGKHFLGEGKFLEAFEAAIIVWAYLDAGLHMKVFTLNNPEKGKVFTV